MTNNNRILSGTALTAVLLLNSVPTLAAEDVTFFGHRAEGKWMIGAKVAVVQNGQSGFDDSTNIGLLIGYEFARPIGFDGTASIEVEGTTSISDGDIDPDSIFGASGEWDADTIALYFAYRTPGTVFFKGKLGVLRSEVTSNVAGVSVENDDASLSWGVGLGVRLHEKFNAELEFTDDTGDTDLSLISLGGNLLF